jgi:hypothetical protein
VIRVNGKETGITFQEVEESQLLGTLRRVALLRTDVSEEKSPTLSGWQESVSKEQR